MLCERLVQAPAAVAEKRRTLALRRSVRVNLDEGPFRPARNVNVLAHPRLDACERSRVVRRDGPAVDAQLEPAGTARKREWTLNHEDAVGFRRSHAGWNAVLVGACPAQIAGSANRSD